YHANTSAQLKGASAKCFLENNCILKEHLTEEMLSQQRYEIIQSFYYYTIKKNKELPNDSYAEESYDIQQIHLISLLEDLLQTKLSKYTKFNDVILYMINTGLVPSNKDSLSCPALFPMCQITARLLESVAVQSAVNIENLDSDQVKNLVEDSIKDSLQLNSLRVVLNKLKAKNFKINARNAELLGIMCQLV
ncbi:9550_t:CDS:2, partial [Gigaspora margarita]